MPPDNLKQLSSSRQFSSFVSPLILTQFYFGLTSSLPRTFQGETIFTHVGINQLSETPSVETDNKISNFLFYKPTLEPMNLLFNLFFKDFASYIIRLISASSHAIADRIYGKLARFMFDTNLQSKQI